MSAKKAATLLTGVGVLFFAAIWIFALFAHLDGNESAINALVAIPPTVAIEAPLLWLFIYKTGELID